VTQEGALNTSSQRRRAGGGAGAGWLVSKLAPLHRGTACFWKTEGQAKAPFHYDFAFCGMNESAPNSPLSSRQPQVEQVSRPRFSRAGSTRYPQRRQFVPSSLPANGSAKRRTATFGAFGLRSAWPAPLGGAVSTGSSWAMVAGSADFDNGGSHTGIACTIGDAGSGATGSMVGGWGGEGVFAQNPSGQVSARTLHGAGRGRACAGFAPSRRTCTTSTTLPLPPAGPPRRDGLSMKRFSAVWAFVSCPFRAGKTRSASDIDFHDHGHRLCVPVARDI
jgi:hypothetical protein